MIDVSATHRFVLLDGLRGLAALAVVAFHVERDGTPYWQIDSFYLWVDFFFVLSGFVLQPSMPRNMQGWGQAIFVFIAKRILRLWPMLIAALALSAAMYYLQMAIVHSRGDGFNYDLSRTPTTYIAALLLLQIWIPASMMMVVPLWSLSAEWFSNLVFVFLTPIKKAIGLLAGIGFGYWLLNRGLNNDKEWISWIGPIRGEEAFGRALIGFGIGILVRLIFNEISQHSKVRIWLANPLLFLGSVGLALWLLNENKNLGYDVLYLAAPVFAFLVFQGAAIPIRADKMFGRFLLKMGAWSFGVYALHRSVMDAFNGWASAPGHWYSTPVYMAPDSVWHSYMWFKGSVVTIVCIFLTELISRFFERPIQTKGKSLISRFERQTAS